jgi:hypothetical protein
MVVNKRFIQNQHCLSGSSSPIFVACPDSHNATHSLSRDAGTEGVGGGGALAPQYLADKLTLFQPVEADSAQPLQLTPQNFFTFRHHCSVVTHSVLEWIQVKYQNLSQI